LTIAALAGLAGASGAFPEGGAGIDDEGLVWERTGGPLGGLGYDIRVNFTDQAEWYVTDAWAGFHVSTDSGLTWFPSNDGLTTRVGAGAADAIPVFSATVDPHDTDIIWAGTQNSGDIFKSTDRGRTWEKKVHGLGADRRFFSFRGFTVDPRGSDTVYAMAEISSAGWTPDGSDRKGLEMDMTKGVVFKTLDGGENWTEIWRGNNLARYCWIDPTNSDVLYVSTGIFDREAANTDVAKGFAGGVGILKSTDGGATWTVQDQRNGLMDLYVGSLFMHPTNPRTLLAAAAENNWSGYFGPEKFTGGVYRTEDEGEHWVRVTSQPEIFSSVEFCTSNPRIAYAGSARAIYRSEDAGLTWERFGRPDGTWGSPGVIAGWPIDMQCDPADDNRVFVNNYGGGNFLSEDGGRSWVSVSRGYTGSFMYSIAVHGESELYAAGRSGIFHSPDAGDTWIGLANPGAALAASGTKMNEVNTLASHPRRPERIVAAPSDIPGVIWTHDAGGQWHLAAGIDRTPLEIVPVPALRTSFYAAVTDFPIRELLGQPASWSALDRPGNGVYVSSDSGMSWSKVPAPEVDGAIISTIAMHPHDPNVIYAAKVDGGEQRASLLRSADAGAQWTTIGTGLPDAVGIRSLAINPSNPDIVFAGVYGRAVYRSTDGGLSFVPSSAGLNPEAVIASIVIHPKWAGNPRRSRVFAGDHRSGVYLSEDGGTNWRLLSEGLVHRTVNRLAISPSGSTLYASIHGDGIYRMRLR
jgi:photosystem II stability/assembly factor-like uncharacterized protein